eukprot:TRINITY_DN15237_c0_g1_i1.p1 TRINITY_DN15237_c0_g1~~TRINITY_DN15237_c0_g1_i1.p1  ORF type:complete len:191 (-),score=42.56 TRINITY_DN15237_c0_g1_i1:10-582(-)
MVVPICEDKVSNVSGPILQYSVVRAIQEIEHILHFRAETGSFHGDTDLKSEGIALALKYQSVPQENSKLTGFLAIERLATGQILRATPISHESSPVDYDHGYNEKVAGHVEMLNLVLLRHYTGFWVLNNDLANIFGLALEILSSAQPLQLSSTPLPESEKTKVWGTALSLAFLTRAVPHLKARWGVIVSK